MDILAGYFAAGLIGVCLGMIGAGGSILTMPVLVYLFHIDPTLATAYSLFIVGATALAGAIRNACSKLVDFSVVFLFGLPSLLGTYFTRGYLLPEVRTVIYTSPSLTITRNAAIMLFFATMMFCAGISMLRKHSMIERRSKSIVFTAVLGFLVGVLTGIVGAGGGFLIIPSLVLFAGLPMKGAVGTSLMIISMKSLLGFGGDISAGAEIDYAFMMSVVGIAVIGIFVGGYLAGRVAAEKLKDGFGWFVVGMSVLIIVQQSLVVITS